MHDGIGRLKSRLTKLTAAVGAGQVVNPVYP
jgi:hypothetical protein